MCIYLKHLKASCSGCTVAVTEVLCGTVHTIGCGFIFSNLFIHSFTVSLVLGLNSICTLVEVGLHNVDSEQLHSLGGKNMTKRHKKMKTR